MLTLRNRVAPISALVWPGRGQPGDGQLLGGQVRCRRRAAAAERARRWPRARCGPAARRRAPGLARTAPAPRAGARAPRRRRLRAAATRRTAGGCGPARPRRRSGRACRSPPGSGARRSSSATRARRARGQPRGPRRPVGVGHRLEASCDARRASSRWPLRTAASTKSGYSSGVTCRNGSSTSGFEPVVGVARSGPRPGRGRRARRRRRRARRRSPSAPAPSAIISTCARGAPVQASMRRVDHVLGVVADRPAQLADLLDVLARPAAGSRRSARPATGSTARCRAAAATRRRGPRRRSAPGSSRRAVGVPQRAWSAPR